MSASSRQREDAPTSYHWVDVRRIGRLALRGPSGLHCCAYRLWCGQWNRAALSLRRSPAVRFWTHLRTARSQNSALLPYVLAAYMLVNSALSFVSTRLQPEPTVLGIGLLIAAAIIMPLLGRAKRGCRQRRRAALYVPTQRRSTSVPICPGSLSLAFWPTSSSISRGQIRPPQCSCSPSFCKRLEKPARARSASADCQRNIVKECAGFPVSWLFSSCSS